MSFDVVWHYVTFRVMSFGIMSHSTLCCIWPYDVRLCVIQRIVALPNVVWRNVVRPTVGVSFFFTLSYVLHLYSRNISAKSKLFAKPFKNIIPKIP